MAVQDPGEKCARWTFEGAPARLEMDTTDLDGLFPQVDPEELKPVDTFNTNFGEF